MPKNKQVNLDVLFNDKNKLIKILNKKPALECILVSVSFLDNCLTSLLEQYLIQPKIINELFAGPLQGFSNKTKLCYCLSLIDQETFNDLKTIGKIRNNFAHSHLLLSFDDTKIIQECNILKTCDIEYPKELLNNLYTEESVIARQRFVFSVIHIMHKILAKCYVNKLIDTTKKQ